MKSFRLQPLKPSDFSVGSLLCHQAWHQLAIVLEKIMPRCARVGCTRLLTYQVLSFFSVRWMFFKSFGTLKKLLVGFVRESSMPAVFSRRDPNLRLFASFGSKIWAFFLDDCAQNLKKTFKNRARFERFWAVYLKNRSKTAQNLRDFERFI